MFADGKATRVESSSPEGKHSRRGLNGPLFAVFHQFWRVTRHLNGHSRSGRLQTQALSSFQDSI